MAISSLFTETFQLPIKGILQDFLARRALNFEENQILP